MHDAPIKEIAWVPEMNLLVTGSWDKTIKYWDTWQQNPAHTQQLPEQCYAMVVALWIATLLITILLTLR
jgi:mRNA export factor